MASDITVFRLPARHLGQLGGAYEAQSVVLAGAAAVAIDYGAGGVQQIAGKNSVASATTVTCANPPAGAGNGPSGLLLLILSADSSGTVTYTFGTGFRVTGTVAVTASKNIVMQFVSDGTNWNQVGTPSTVV